MNDARDDRNPPGLGHLSELEVEQLAEGALAEAEEATATLHVQRCGRCAAEVESARALLAVLGELPRFAPSPVFADAVMARVQVGAKPSPLLVRARRWLPVTGRGWAIVAAAIVVPPLPMIALVAWLLARPLVSPAGLWQWAAGELRGAGSAAFAFMLDTPLVTGLVGWAQAGWALASATPAPALTGAAAFLAVAIPLSAWSLVRLVRTPSGPMTYAN